MLLALAGAGGERAFGDWAVACDNGKRCEAALLRPAFARAHGDLVVARDAGPLGKMTIELWPEKPARGYVDLLIDGRLVATGLMGAESVRIEGGEAEGLGRALVNGRMLTMRAGKAIIARYSLTGSAAALRFFDAEQGRAGGVTALAARGRAPASQVLRASPLPRVPALRPPKGEAKVSAALIATLAERSQCALEASVTDGPPRSWRLDSRSVLLLIPCGSGAYNYHSAAYVVTGGTGTPAQFDVAPDTNGGGAPMLTNAEWDPAAATLSHVERYQQMNRCGESRKWVWDGSRFRLIEEAGLTDCRGAAHWPARFRAVPAWR